jgi:hypothetical protein
MVEAGRKSTGGAKQLAGADLDVTAHKPQVPNRLRFQQHQSTSDIDDISIIMTAFPSSIHRLPEVI